MLLGERKSNDDAFLNAMFCFSPFAFGGLFSLPIFVQPYEKWVSYRDYLHLLSAYESLLCIYGGSIQQSFGFRFESGSKHFYAYCRITWVWSKKLGLWCLIPGEWREIFLFLMSLVWNLLRKFKVSIQKLG